jgi:hypothetical protein
MILWRGCGFPICKITEDKTYAMRFAIDGSSSSRFFGKGVLGFSVRFVIEAVATTLGPLPPVPFTLDCSFWLRACCFFFGSPVFLNSGFGACDCGSSKVHFSSESPQLATDRQITATAREIRDAD